MERSAIHHQMSLTLARTVMYILLLVPLLVAHRHPHFSRPSASILRRMPMFYGKRDAALASSPPSGSQSFLPESAVSVLSGPGSSLSLSHSASSSGVPSRYADSRQHLRQSGRPGSAEKRGSLKVRSKQQRFVSERSESEDGRRPDFGLPSVLLLRLYDHISKDGDSDGNDGDTANVFADNGARLPQFLHSEVWNQPHQSGADGRIHKKAAAADSQPAADREGLMRRLSMLGAALGEYDRDGYKAISQTPEEDEGSELVLLELKDGGGSQGGVDDLYYGDLLDNLISDGDSADDGYGNSDETFEIGPLESGI